MLSHRLRRWHNIAAALSERVVFAGSPRLTSRQKTRHARHRFDNHGQINDTVSLKPIHTPLFIYINNDLI